MSDDNRIKGPGYYPRRPGKPVEPKAAPAVTRSLWFDGFDDGFEERALREWRSTIRAVPTSVPRPAPAPTPPQAPRYSTVTGTRANASWGSSWFEEDLAAYRYWAAPAANYSQMLGRLERHTRTPAPATVAHDHPRHDGNVPAPPGDSFWCFRQHQTYALPREYDRARGISDVILVEAPNRRVAESVLEDAGVRFDGARWRRGEATNIGSFTTSQPGPRGLARAGWPEGTFVHRDGVIEEITDRPRTSRQEPEEEPNR